MLLEEAAVVVAQLRRQTVAFKDNKQTCLETEKSAKKVQSLFEGADSQEGVSGGVADVGERVHVDVVIVQLLRRAAAASLCEQHAQPPAQVLRAVGLRGPTRRLQLPRTAQSIVPAEHRSCAGQVSAPMHEYVTSRDASSFPDCRMQKEKGCLGPRPPGTTSAPLSGTMTTGGRGSPGSFCRYRFPARTTHQRSFQEPLRHTLR